VPDSFVRGARVKYRWIASLVAVCGTLSATYTAPAKAQPKLTPAYTYCYLYGQKSTGRDWQFYISQVGQIMSPTGEGWPDSPRDPIAGVWRAHLVQSGVDVAMYEQKSNPNFPFCHGYSTQEEAEKWRAHTLGDVQKSRAGYTIHELPWRPSGVNLSSSSIDPAALAEIEKQLAQNTSTSKRPGGSEQNQAEAKERGTRGSDQAADEAERARTEALNSQIANRDAAVLAENAARRQRFTESQLNHQRQIEASARARREHEAAVARSQAEAAAYEKQLQEYQRQLASGNFDRAAAASMRRDSEEKLRLAKATEERLAEQKRNEEERNRPVEFKEGVVLCEAPKAGGKQWRCQGPLQTTYGELDAPSGNVALRQACGTDRPIRDLGLASGYRAFGCGFGMHPTATDYPGNNDVPARLQIYVSDRATFRCPRSTLAYCRVR
jgi:hypothetical protein